jgi:hypothetical protein
MGETTWDRPTNAGAAAEEENSLASGWFAVVDPQSGDVYYANELTGETSWEKPISFKDIEQSATQEGNGHGMSRLSLSMHDNTVYEDDSVTSSQY